MDSVTSLSDGLGTIQSIWIMNSLDKQESLVIPQDHVKIGYQENIHNDGGLSWVTEVHKKGRKGNLFTVLKYFGSENALTDCKTPSKEIQIQERIFMGGAWLVREIVQMKHMVCKYLVAT